MSVTNFITILLHIIWCQRECANIVSYELVAIFSSKKDDYYILFNKFNSYVYQVVLLENWCDRVCYVVGSLPVHLPMCGKHVNEGLLTYIISFASALVSTALPIVVRLWNCRNVICKWL